MRKSNWIYFIVLLVPTLGWGKEQDSKSSWVGPQSLKQVGSSSTDLNEFERDYPVRHIKPLSVTNVKGSVSVQGWALDKVRIKVKRTVLGTSIQPSGFRSLHSEFRFDDSGDRLELSSQYPKELSIEERLRERERPQVRLDFTIYAPSTLQLKVWTVQGDVTIKNWNSWVQVRTHQGHIRMDSVRGEQVLVVCDACQAELKSIRASVRCHLDQGGLSLNQVEGKSIFAEVGEGKLSLSQVSGQQLYSSRSSEVTGQSVSGKVEFHSENSKIDLSEVSGLISGRIEKGSLKAKFREWKATDQAMIDAQEASIELYMPKLFSSQVDLWSVRGSVEVGYPVEALLQHKQVGPQPANRIQGRIREGGPLLQILTETGSIRLLRDPT